MDDKLIEQKQTIWIISLSYCGKHAWSGSDSR